MVNALHHLRSPCQNIMSNYTIINISISLFIELVWQLYLSQCVGVCVSVLVWLCKAQKLLIYAWQIFSIQTHNLPSLLIKSIQSTILISLALPLSISVSRYESFFVLPGQKSRNHESVKSKCRHFVVAAAKLSDFLSASVPCRDSFVRYTRYTCPLTFPLPPRTPHPDADFINTHINSF